MQCHETAIGLHRLHSNPELLGCLYILWPLLVRRNSPKLHSTLLPNMWDWNVTPKCLPNHTARHVPESSDTTNAVSTKLLAMSRNISHIYVLILPASWIYSTPTHSILYILQHWLQQIQSTLTATFDSSTCSPSLHLVQYLQLIVKTARNMHAVNSYSYGQTACEKEDSATRTQNLSVLNDAATPTDEKYLSTAS